MVYNIGMSIVVAIVVAFVADDDHSSYRLMRSFSIERCVDDDDHHHLHYLKYDTMMIRRMITVTITIKVLHLICRWWSSLSS